MSIVLTGSIATDRDQVDRLAIRRGDAAGNIAFGLGSLGLQPVLVGAVGAGFERYRRWLTDHSVDTKSVRVSTGGSVEPDEVGTIELRAVVDRLGSVEFVVISPDEPELMVRRARECREAGFPFVADPCGQLTELSGWQLRELVAGATCLFTSVEQSQLLEERTGWSSDEIHARVGAIVVTHGPNGVSVQRRGEPVISVVAVGEHRERNPAGVSDAFRAGFLAGLSWELTDEHAAGIGCLLATLAFETAGTQAYTVSPPEFVERFAESYGLRAAADVEARLLAKD